MTNALRIVRGCTLALCGSVVYLASCTHSDRSAGAVIDTSTLQARVQGRSVARVQGEWFVVEDSVGNRDSVQVDSQGELELAVLPQQSLSLEMDHLAYYAYRIVPTDTIRPSATLRFLFPNYTAWDSVTAPWIAGQSAFVWNGVHRVWESDNLPAGRHLVRWVENADTLSADLVVHEMANRFEREDAGPEIPSGSLRPKDCGFAPFDEVPMQHAGLGCPHTESDAFNRGGTSVADLREWSDTLVGFLLATSSNGGQTLNPYAKLILEFQPDEAAYDISGYDSLVLRMDIPIGDSVRVRLAQSTLSVARWYSRTLRGVGLANYAMALDTTDFGSIPESRPLDLQQIFGLEFRDQAVGSQLSVKLYSLEFR